MKFVLASHNKKKLRELGDILGALGIEIVPLPEDAPEPEETGDTFEANAQIKARAAAEFTGLPAIADDSGLCVDALNGAPGEMCIRDSRYAVRRNHAGAGRQPHADAQPGGSGKENHEKLKMES